MAQELAFFLASPAAGVLADRAGPAPADDRVRPRPRGALPRRSCSSGLRRCGSRIRCSRRCRVFSAPFEPASSAAVPNLVDAEDLATGERAAGSLWGTMLAVGAALGGVVSTVFGRDTAFVVDAALVPAVGAVPGRYPALVHRSAGRRPRAPQDRRGHQGDRCTTRARDQRVLALLTVKGGFGLAAGVLALIPVFGADVFGKGDIGVGILMAARGVGALVGPFLGHRLAGPRASAAVLRDRPRARRVRAVLHGVGRWLPRCWVAAVAIFVAHLGGGSQWMLSTYGLQLLVPDHIRGRIFAVRLRADHAVPRDLEPRRLLDRRRRRAATGRVRVGRGRRAVGRRLVDPHPQGPQRSGARRR